jgi:hypothetical protein
LTCDPDWAGFLGLKKKAVYMAVQAKANYKQSGHQKVSDAFLNNYGKREFN